MKIFYNISEKKIRNISHSAKDAGIFFEHAPPSFKGILYVTKVYKFKHLYDYEKLMYGVYKKNRPLFQMGDEDISTMCTKFLLRTNNFFGRNSIGNYLAMIDILDEVIDKKEDITLFMPKREIDIHHLVNEYSRIRGVSIKIKDVNQQGLKPPNWSIKSFLVLRVLLRLFYKKEKPKEKIIFIESPLRGIGYFKRIKECIKDYSILKFDPKNLLREIKCVPYLLNECNVYYGYSIKTLFEALGIQNRFLKSAKKHKLSGVVYKEIDITHIAGDIMGSLKKVYSFLIADSLVVSHDICKDGLTIFFGYNDDPLLESIALNRNKKCKKIGAQYDLICPGGVYNINRDIGYDYELVWNKYSKDILTKLYSYPEKKVIIIGNIRFEKVDKIRHKNINIVLADSENSPEIKDMFIEAIKKNKNRRLKFFIKPHPAEFNDGYLKKIDPKEAGIIKGSIEDALKCADVIVAFNSTAVLEAIYNDIPAIIINPYKETPNSIPFYKFLPYFESSGALARFFDALKSPDRIKKDLSLKIDELRKDKLKEIMDLKHTDQR